MTKKKKLLLLRDESKDLKENEFIFNRQFKSKTKKFTLKEAKFENEGAKDSAIVDVMRKQAVQSVVVRLMKSRKELPYNKLVLEVEKLMLKFRPTTRV